MFQNRTVPSGVVHELSCGTWPTTDLEGKRREQHDMPRPIHTNTRKSTPREWKEQMSQGSVSMQNSICCTHDPPAIHDRFWQYTVSPSTLFPSPEKKKKSLHGEGKQNSVAERTKNNKLREH